MSSSSPSTSRPRPNLLRRALGFAHPVLNPPSPFESMLDQCKGFNRSSDLNDRRPSDAFLTVTNRKGNQRCRIVFEDMAGFKPQSMFVVWHNLVLDTGQDLGWRARTTRDGLMEIFSSQAKMNEGIKI
ncbi:unnamed protein product [Vicia faba]|uniref:Uncharacterized protein n=1 Tax=Vicia faba TaxID=3906 RepID=A0AAV0ZVQ6_VICFA|nr:unnamed protein product [Vicia faba]